MVAPLIATDLRKNSLDTLLAAALVLLTNHEVNLGDIPPIKELTDLRDILEELRDRRVRLRASHGPDIGSDGEIWI